MDLLSVDGFSKKYGARSVLHNVSFSILRGEVLGLIGPNGAGEGTIDELCGQAGDYTLAEPVSGKIGLWSKTDSVSYFDEFTVTPAAK
jgi:ABC-type multidrug transport system ATPase subunit